jgi:hypothetical protein
VARPSEYSAERGDLICDLLVEGLSLRKICKRADMPSVGTVLRWVAADAGAVDGGGGFQKQYMLARVEQAGTFADESVYIADTPKIGTTITTKTVMVKALDPETGFEVQMPVTETRTKKGDMLGHRALQVSARQWAAARMDPKKWGSRLELDGQVAFKPVSSEPLSEDEWAQKHAPEPA